MDHPNQDSPTIQGKLPESNTEEDQHVLSEWIEGQMEARNQSFLIEGHKPGLVNVGILNGHCQGKAIGEQVLLPNLI